MKQIRKYLIPLITSILLFFIQSYAGTTGKIAGQVVDSQTGDPLPGVNVIVVETLLGAATDMDGYYFILNVPPGTYSVQTMMIGYKTTTKTEVQVSTDKTSEVQFRIETTTLEGDEVTVVAERPVIEKDLTASQVVISADQIAQSWISDINEAMSLETGITVSQGFLSARGGAFVDVNYILDGTSLNSGIVGDNYSGINKTSVQELRVLTGAFNAEYGNALSGIVDVVTKENSGRITGNLEFKYRPAGTYHWGRYFYSHNMWDWTNFDLDYWTTNNGGRPDLTPQERLTIWQDFVGNPDPIMRDYNKRGEWHGEGTIAGGITQKLSFMLSSRYTRGVNIYPQALKYNPEWNNQLKLTYKFSPKIKVLVSGLLGGFQNAGNSNTFTHSSELGQNNVGNRGTSTQITDPYEFNKYFPFARPFNGDVEYLDLKNISAKITHTLSASSFYEVQIGHFYEYLRQEQDNTRFFEQYPVEVDGDNWYWADHFRNNYVLGVGTFTSLEGSPREWMRSKTAVNSIKANLTSQVHRSHLIKTGLEFSQSSLDFELLSTLYRKNTRGNLWLLMDGNPIEFAAYIQDKIELVGMVINAGVRLDYYDPRGEQPVSIYDRYATKIGSEGHDPDDPNNIWSGWDNVPFRKTPSRYRFAPRFGISHPITETTVLHFSYGHFNMRPSWVKILSMPYRWVQTMDNEPTPHSTPLIKMAGLSSMDPNPLLEFEKLIEYEVGFDQDLAGLLRIDATVYYKEGKHLTTGSLMTATGVLTESPGGSRSDAVTRVHSTSAQNGNPLYMYSNVGHRDARGIELTVETKFLRHFNVRASYDFSQNLAGFAGWSQIYEPVMNQVDRRHSGDDAEQKWTPAHRFKINGILNSPVDFGPAIAKFRPLGNWSINLFFEAQPGQVYTYHFPEDVSTEQNNRRWKAYYNANLFASKLFDFMGLQPEIGIEVRNLFNYKMLSRPGGDNLENYLRTGDLWAHPVSGEPNEWGWYSNQKRQVYFRFGLNF